MTISLPPSPPVPPVPTSPPLPPLPAGPLPPAPSGVVDSEQARASAARRARLQDCKGIEVFIGVNPRRDPARCLPPPRFGFADRNELSAPKGAENGRRLRYAPSLTRWARWGWARRWSRAW